MATLANSINAATTLTVPPPGLVAATPGAVPQLVAFPAHGSLTLGSPTNDVLTPGSFVYTPDANFIGSDSFTFQSIVEGHPPGSPVTVQLTVTPPVNAPVANNDLYNAPATSNVVADTAHGLLANDADPSGKPLSAHLVSGPAEGTLDLSGDGSFIYVPSGTATTPDHFTYYASNGSVNSPPQTVWITHQTAETNTAVPDSYAVPANQPSSIGPAQGVLVNDVHPGAASPASFLLGQTQHGTVSLAPDGSFEYMPASGFTGQDHFTYAVTGGAANASATVTLNVDPHVAAMFLG